MRKHLISTLVALGLGVISMPSAMAAPTKASFDNYVSGIKAEARRDGISDIIINEAFANIQFVERAVKADRNQPERKLTLDEYLNKAVPQWKINLANKRYQENKTVLDRIGQEYGVSPKFIVALWGIESNFGRITGNYNVVEALTTLAYEGRRAAFFRGEVMDALQILNEGHIKPSEMKGSWAGAMGQSQFMPSSYLTFAVDGNNDGKIDIWNTKADVFASAANYLKKSGWKDGYTWGRPVRMAKAIPEAWVGTKMSKGEPLSVWKARGVTKLNGQALPNVDIKAWLIQPDDNHGHSYLIYNNYQTLLKWNRSNYFALAVSLLADSIH